MDTFPVFLRLHGRRCVVVGGDDPAAGRAFACERAGGAVTVVAEALVPALREAVTVGRLQHVPRGYRRGDLTGAFACWASLRDPAEIARLRAEASAERVLLNVIDVPDACDFFTAAVVERGALRIAIGTGGRSPALAARLRERFDDEIGEEFGALVEILGAVRQRLDGRPDRHEVLRTLARSELPALLRARDLPAVDRLLAAAAGADCSLAHLGIVPGTGG